MDRNGALSTIQIRGPKRLDSTYEAIAPIPVLGRLKAVTASISAALAPPPCVSRSRAEAAGIVDGFINHTCFITETSSIGLQGFRPARYVSLQQRLEAMDLLSAIIDLSPGIQASASSACSGPAIKCEPTCVDLAGFRDKVKLRTRATS